jgi:hypothetical protein
VLPNSLRLILGVLTIVNMAQFVALALPAVKISQPACYRVDLGEVSGSGRGASRKARSQGAPLLGIRIPGLEILEEIGRGGQSVVYRVRRKGSLYALKVMRDFSYQEQAAMFRRGAALRAGLDHSGIVRLYE